MIDKKIPMRKCVGCNKLHSKKDLLRITKLDDELVLDRKHKMNGRSAYICSQEECLKLALKNKGFERSLKCKIPTTIYEVIRQEID